jgi:hypothetical protein
VDYVQVLSDPEQMETMLRYSEGARRVPVIVEGDQVTIGFEGKT